MTRNLRGPGAASMAFAAALTVLAGVHATHGTFDDRLTTTADYVNDGSFTVALLAFAVAVQGMACIGRPPRWAMIAATAGPVVVAAGVVPALITGESPAWFAVAGVPGNLMWLVGTIALGRWAWKAAALPRPLALGVAFTVPSALLLAEIGGSIVAALVWAAIAVRWLAAERRSPSRPAAVAAG